MRYVTLYSNQSPLVCVDLHKPEWIDIIDGIYYADSDTIWGGNDNDIIDGGDGDDSWLEGYKGNDTIRGGAGNDKLFGSNGNDNLNGGAGNDELNGGDGNDTLDGGDGNDRILTGDGIDIVQGGNGNDEVNGFPVDASGRYTFYTYSGSKTIYGNSGNDFLYGGSDADSIFGGNDDDTQYGSAGNDVLDGGDGNDTLYGGLGNDTLIGGTGNDNLFGEEGDDNLDGGAGNDELYGGDGNDTYHVRSITQYIYDSAGTDTAYVYANFVKIPNTIENVQYRDGAIALPNWISALIPDSGAGLRFSDLLGDAKTFFYTFPTIISAHHAADAEDKLNWTAFTSTQQARVEYALSYISTVIGVSFVKSTDSTAPNTITFANNNQTDSAGYAYYPLENSAGSDLFLDNSENSDNAFLRDGNYSALTLIHELGHSLGLRHPFASASAGGGIAEPPYLSSAEDKTAWTVMSYTALSNEYFLRFSTLDIAALQYMYGPSTTARTGNDTYSVNAFGSNFIWDGGGIDELSAANANTGCTIYLTPGYWGCVGTSKASSITSSGQITVNFGTVIENLTGSEYTDALYGNESGNTINGGAGNDVIEGWAGDDTLIGGLGDDRIDGGEGVDVAYFNGLRANYAVSWSSTSSSFTVKSNVEGTDTLVGIETLRFTDTFVSASSFQNTVAPAIALSTSKATLSVIVEKGVLGRDAVLLKDLKEVKTTLDGRVLSHTVEYAGAVFAFTAIDPLITTVTRDGEFTQEFRVEIAQAYPGVENILYADAVAIVGVTNIDQILLGVAGFDGNFVS